MQKLFKKLLIVVFCLIFQVNCCVLAEDITKNPEYQKVMAIVRQKYANGEIQPLEPDSIPPNVDIPVEYFAQEPDDTGTKPEPMISLYPNADIPLIATIRDKYEVITPEQTNIFMTEDSFTNTVSEQDNNLYSDDFVEDIEKVTPLSESITTVIPQDDYNKKSDNNIGLCVMLAFVVLYCILGWNLDFDKVSSDDADEKDNTNQQKTVKQTQTYHNSDSQEEPDKSDKIPVIKSAIQNGYKLKILYKNKDRYNNKPQETTRIITPISIKSGLEINNKFINKSKNCSRQNLFYLSAYCHLKQAERLFRLDRLEILEVIKT